MIAAIHAANGNGAENTITLAAGTYILTAVDNDTDGPNGLPSITSLLTIQGTGAETTVIERGAAPASRILHVAATGTLTLEGVTLRGGSIGKDSEPGIFPGRGGGLFNAGGTVTLLHSILTGNGAWLGSGGGLFNAGGTVTLLHSTLTGNSAESEGFSGGGLSNNGGTVSLLHSTLINNSVGVSGGGAALESSGGTVTLISSTVANNRMARGGGHALSNSGTMTIRDSAVVGNGGTEGGGGIGNGGTMTILNSTIARNGDLSGISNGGTLTIIDSTIAENYADDCCDLAEGGGISNFGTLTITNSTIAKNTASSGHEAFGGGISNFGALTITNSTIAQNRVAAQFFAQGGGLFNSLGTVQLQNTILAGNSTLFESPDCLGPVTSQGHNLIGDRTGCDIALQATDLTGDPGLGAFTDAGTPGDGHFPLHPSSRAIDAGDPAACPRKDQLGHPRVGVCDMGAIEFQTRCRQSGAALLWGRITEATAPTGLPGVTMVLLGPAGCRDMRLAKGLGLYGFGRPAEGTYTVQPSKGSCTFTPPTQTVTLAGDHVRVDFAASCP
jgi:hypothetical protein